MNEKKSVLAEGLSEEKGETGILKEFLMGKNISDEMLIKEIDKCGETNDIAGVFDLVKKAGELSNPVNIKLAKLLNEKAWSYLAEDFVNTNGVCKEAKEIAKGGIWEVDRGRPIMPKRFGKRLSKPEPKPKSKQKEKVMCR